MKTCLACNAQNPDHAQLCEKCGAPLPDHITPGAPVARKSKLPWIIGGVLLVAAIAAGVWFFMFRSSGDSKSLVRGLPKSVAVAAGVNVAPILEIPIVKEQLAKQEVKSQIELAKGFSGVDFLAMKGVSFGVSVKDNSIHLLAVAKGSFNVEHMRTTVLKMVGPTKEVKGVPLFSFDLAKMMPRRMPKQAFDNLPKPAGDAGEGGEGAEGGEKAEIVEPKEPEFVDFPSVASVVLGPIDDSTFIVGSEAMVEAYLTGGDTLSDDAELGALVDRISPNAIYWGIGRLKKDSPEGKLIAQLSEAVAGPMAGFVMDTILDANGWFEVEWKDGMLIRGGSILASEDAAKAAKEKVEGAMKGMEGMYEAMGVKPEVKLEGKELKFEMTIKLDNLTKLGGL